MNFSNLWKGLAVVAVLFLFSMEASAQLPVRTQVVQYINPLGGTVSLDVNNDPDGAGVGVGTATTTSYSISWPANSNTTAASGDQAILLGTYVGAGGTNIDLSWYEIDGFVDGIGATNHVTFWSPDDNTLDAQEAFEFDPATGTFTVGVNNIASGAGATGIEAATAGIVQVGDGSANETVVIDGTSATATIGRLGAGAVTGVAGSVVLADGGIDATANSVTLQTGTQTANQIVQFDIPTTAGAAGDRWLPLATNQATTQYYILISNGDGTATWSQNPAGEIKSGSVVPAAGDYSGNVAFTTPYIDPDGAGPLTAPIPAVVITPNGNDAYIIQVTSITAAGFTWESTAPFDGADAISWISNAPSNP